MYHNQSLFHSYPYARITSTPSLTYEMEISVSCAPQQTPIQEGC
jgi:hypothetical protein